MSNHSSDFDETMRAKLLREVLQDRERFEMMGEKLGATGEMPEKRLTPQDEGAIKFAIGTKDGKVVIDFGSPVSWIGMPPENALRLGQLLIKRARQISNEPLAVTLD